jgi:hypothetical protein
MEYPMVFDQKRPETTGKTCTADRPNLQVRRVNQELTGNISPAFGGIRGLWVRVPRGRLQEQIGL